MSLGQKIKISLSLFLLRIFKTLEISDVLGMSLFRTLMLLVLLSFFFLGFYVESKETEFLRYIPLSSPIKLSPIKTAPVLVKDIPYPDISAKSALIIDVESGRKLFELDIYEKYPLASTTKLMTALVALDLYSMDEVLVTPGNCADIDGSRLGLASGEKMRVEDLLMALLISSSNDAACVLGSGRTSISDFVSLMNERAQEFGLENTLFDNPIGFDSFNNSNYSCAHDLYLLAEEAMKVDFIENTVKMDEVTLKTGIIPRKIYTTNHLLWAIPETYGIKTGKTLAAGEVLVYGYRKDEKDLVIVVMGSKERFLDTRHLLEWTLGSYVWK